MARRRKSSSRVITRTVVAKAPTPTIRIAAPANIRSYARSARRGVRRAGRSAGRAVMSEKHTITALVAAAALGFAEKSGMSIPTIGPVGPAGTVGLAAWAYGRWGKNQTAQHLATGLLCVAINRWAATGTIAGEGDPRAVVYDDED